MATTKQIESAAAEALEEMEVTIENRKVNSFVEVDIGDLLRWHTALTKHFAPPAPTYAETCEAAGVRVEEKGS